MHIAEALEPDRADRTTVEVDRELCRRSGLRRAMRDPRPRMRARVRIGQPVPHIDPEFTVVRVARYRVDIGAPPFAQGYPIRRGHRSPPVTGFRFEATAPAA